MSTKFKRGAKPSPRHKLLAATPHRVTTAPPPQFAVVPKQLSYWLNNQDGDCVTAEEAFAKAAYSVQTGNTELFVPDSEVQQWASAHGFLNGANLTDVMDAMAASGFVVNGQTYGDGPYSAVDFSNEEVLQSAISTGTVKIGIDADALPSTAGNGNGWYATGGTPGQFSNEDHCVALTGYGTAAYLFEQLGLPVPSGLDPTSSGYLLFTWDSIGFVDHVWIMSTVGEAWVRNPTTPGTSPSPSPSPSPAIFTNLTLTGPFGFLRRQTTETFAGLGSVSGTAASFTVGGAGRAEGNAQFAFNETEQCVLLEALERFSVGSGRISRATWQNAVASNTTATGTINWNGLTTFLTTVLPEVAALIVALGPLFGG